MDFLGPQETSGLQTGQDDLAHMLLRLLQKFGWHPTGSCRGIAIPVAPKARQIGTNRPKTSIFACFCPYKSMTPSIVALGFSTPRRAFLCSFTWCSRILPNLSTFSKRTRFAPKKGPKWAFLSRNDCACTFFSR